MSRSSRVLVLLLLAGVIAAPLATLHPIAAHLSDAGESGLPHELRNIAVIALFVVLGASIVPVANMARVVLTWINQARTLRALRIASESRTDDDGMAYWLFAATQVHFFTAGLLRPRIYASSGASEQLDPLAFRAALLHEREHQRGHHVAWRLALAALETAFHPVRPARRIVNSLALECEFAADRAALAAGADRVHLFDAVVAANGSPPRPSSVALSGTGTLQRLEALTSTKQPGSISPGPLVWLVVGLSALPILAHTLFWLGAVCL